jgi:hypothetical protein
MFLTKYCSIVLIVCTEAVSQSGVIPPQTLYGQPVREVYMARPTVKVEVNYSSDHEVCKIDIQSTVADWTKPTKESLEQVLEEIVPSSMRGSGRLSLYERMGCGGLNSTEYGEMFVDRVKNYCGPKSVTSPPTTVVLFKSKSCERLRNSKEKGD